MPRNRCGRTKTAPQSRAGCPVSATAAGVGSTRAGTAEANSDWVLGRTHRGLRNRVYDVMHPGFLENRGTPAVRDSAKLLRESHSLLGPVRV